MNLSVDTIVARSRVEELEAENAALRARIADLEANGIRLFPRRFDLSANQAKMLALLMRPGIFSKDMLMRAIWEGRNYQPNQKKLIDVMIYKMREKLSPLGIEILTMWGQGYYLTPQTKERVREMMRAEGIAA